MTINRTALGGAALLFALGSVGPASGALVPDRQHQTVYDTTNNITWLADANFAVKKKFGVRGINSDGSMTWTVAKNWVAAMNAQRYLGSKHWNLPDTKRPDAGCSQNPKSSAFGYGCKRSQLANLFYQQLGGVQGSTIDLKHNANYGLFSHFKSYLYWSSTLWKKVPNSAFSFSFGNGFQGTNVFANTMYALPVAPGRVGDFKTAPPTPRPLPSHHVTPKCVPPMKCPKPV